MVRGAQVAGGRGTPTLQTSLAPSLRAVAPLAPLLAYPSPTARLGAACGALPASSSSSSQSCTALSCLLHSPFLRLHSHSHSPSATAAPLQRHTAAAPSTSSSARSGRALHGRAATALTAVNASGAGPAASASSAAPAAIVLGIESSCDDTGVAVVTSDGRVLGEAIATQADIHSQWGGVVPNLARDAHAAAIDAVVERALAAAGLRPEQLSAVAVTVGPGLGLCLRVGAAKAREIARAHRLPLVSVHHMEAHALVARLPAAAAAAAPPAVRLAAVAAPTSPSAATGSTASWDTRMELRPEAPDVVGSGSDASSSTSLASSSSVPASSTAAESAAAAYASGATSGAADGASSSSGAAPQAGATATERGPTASTSGRGGGGGAAAAASGDRELDAAAVLADVSAAAASLPFPFLCLLVSGGHNLLVLVRGVGSYVQLGTTMDDALGEAYDKVARLLALEMRPHGGAALEALARQGDATAFKFAVPMRKYGTCDFSFAGLKTSARLAIEQTLSPAAVEGLSPEQVNKAKADIAASFQSVAVTHLLEKSRRGVAWAREMEPGLAHLVVAGGVACNQVVRAALNQLADKEGLQLVLPPPRWCTDNGVMTAWAGIERLARGWAEPPPPPLPLPSPAEREAAAVAAAAAAEAAAAYPASLASVGEEEVAGVSGSGAAAAAAATGGAAGGGEEWIELKPRWPLTSELHPRSAAAQADQRRSIKKVRMAVPLSDLEPPSPPPGLAAGAAAAGAGAAAAGAAR
ncbi:hypothetical protein CHLRE_14g615500v5 [Chlamydomonas reinhardtii]|uniref:Glycoprotease 1 n=1 Tax=Chlamydomonas reinhardtii TaxID=3055 RepID=A0A2K3CXJ6_CHLRE|nr:uncharacterized protein CHLRE_14g615500v5 [Chlamydomonas reinhardtii]PNW73015.1 hypothetical protein CHLRE_14g615500v5 [Chlamydomonas reinhardtii]